MLHLSSTNCSSTSELIDHAIGAAEYYGFSPLESTLLRQSPSSSHTRINSNEMSFVRKDEKSLVPLVNKCARYGLCSSELPVFFWSPGAVNKSGPQKHISLELHALGVPSAIGEALLISVAQAIAEDVGLERRIVRLNSIGSHDSSARYVRELSAYLRKNSDSIAESILSKVATDPLGALLSLVEKQSPIITRAPQSMEFLNEEERKHLSHVLEYLETTKAYYELSPFVLGSRDCWTHTLFEIHGIHEESESPIPFARGGRYDKLVSRATDSQSSGAGMTITFELKGNKTPTFKSPLKTKAPEPKIYFAHLGIDAKRRSLPVMEDLRRAHIDVRQSLAYERLGEQMAEARALHVPHLIIMGFKEANEGTILVRDARTNSQRAVPTDELVTYLRRHKIAA